MARLRARINNRLVLFGIDLRQTMRAARAWPAYRRSLRAFRRQAAGAKVRFGFSPAYVCLDEDVSDSGLAKGHYFHQDLLVARRIHRAQPRRHIDVGSRVDGFVAHVASFRPIEVLDIRSLPSTIPNVTFLQADMMAPLPVELTGCCDSLSCLHALEHFGLGRYGDPLDYDGYRKGLDNLTDMLLPGGTLYLSVPMGPQRVEFNAHRVFSLGFLLELVSGGFSVARFSYVDDAGDLHEDVPLAEESIRTDFGCTYGCAILELTRR